MLGLKNYKTNNALITPRETEMLSNSYYTYKLAISMTLNKPFSLSETTVSSFNLKQS